MKKIIIVSIYLLHSLTSFTQTKVLEVPYYVQPDKKTCQSTCLKMYAEFISDKLSIAFSQKSISEIYNEINLDKNTGKLKSKNLRNSWVSFASWLNSLFKQTLFEVCLFEDAELAKKYIINSIDLGYPVILSTSNTRTSGHIVLIVGYKNFDNYNSNPDFKFICHDPYGKFFPELMSDLYGNRRYEEGLSLEIGGESGPGKFLELSFNSLKRNNKESSNYNKYGLVGIIK